MPLRVPKSPRKNGVDPNQKIDPTPFTVGFVLSAMSGTDSKWDKLVANRALKRVTVHPIAVGFLSFVARIHFFFDGIPEPFSVVLKVSTRSCDTVLLCKKLKFTSVG